VVKRESGDVWHYRQINAAWARSTLSITPLPYQIQTGEYYDLIRVCEYLPANSTCSLADISNNACSYVDANILLFIAITTLQSIYANRHVGIGSCVAEWHEQALSSSSNMAAKAARLPCLTFSSLWILTCARAINGVARVHCNAASVAKKKKSANSIRLKI